MKLILLTGTTVVHASGALLGYEHKLMPSSDVDRISSSSGQSVERLPYSNLYGDVMLTPLQEELFRSISSGSRQINTMSPEERGAVKGKEWKRFAANDGHHIVPYFFDETFPSDAAKRVRKALDDFKSGSTHTSLQFYECIQLAL